MLQFSSLQENTAVSNEDTVHFVFLSFTVSELLDVEADGFYEQRTDLAFVMKESYGVEKDGKRLFKLGNLHRNIRKCDMSSTAILQTEY